jgi:uncharacterized protein (DUF1800 family)
MSSSNSAAASIFPREPGPRPPLKEPPRGEGSLPGGAQATTRRRLLRSLTGGSLAITSTPERAPHRDPVLTLVHRITQGFNLTEYLRAKSLGYEGYLEEQLDHLAIDDSAMDARMVKFPTLNLTPRELYNTYSESFTVPYYEFKGAALVRAVHSKRQLFERMVEFWNDHFCIDQNKGSLEWVFLPEHDRDVIRAHALGSFPAMLSACAHGAAMLFYLDNWLNVASAPQANYSRELLELHSLGVHGGYNEFDVTEVARCFTGWTLNPHTSSPDHLRGHFDISQHDGGKKLVLGHEIGGGPRARSADDSTPQKEAQRVIDIVVAHPSTARFIALKLIRWFLTPEPPEEIVERVAATFTATNGDIKSMLRVILAKENMAWASTVRRPKFRRPFHYMVSMLRMFGADVRDPIGSLIFYLPAMGHMPFDHVQPNGYPDTVEAWGTLLLPRWDFASQLLKPGAGVSHSIPGVVMPTWPVLKQRLGFSGESDRAGLAARMNVRLFGSQLPPYEEDVLQGYIDGYAGTFDISAMFDTLVLGSSLPGFQWY